MIFRRTFELQSSDEVSNIDIVFQRLSFRGIKELIIIVVVKNCTLPIIKHSIDSRILPVPNYAPLAPATVLRSLVSNEYSLLMSDLEKF